jgi:hypothetical protein
VVGDDGQPIKAMWDPIVDPDVWETMRDILADSTRRANVSPARSYLLSGLVVCGLCGTTMHSQPSFSKRRYGCPSPGQRGGGCAKVSRKAEAVEEQTRNTVFRWLDSGEYDRALANAAANPSRMRELSERVQVLRAEIIKLQDTQIQARLDEDEIEAQSIKRVRTRKERDLEAAIRELHEEQGQHHLIIVQERGEALRAAWDRWSLTERRRIIKGLVDHVEVYPTTTGRAPYDERAVRVLPNPVWAKLSATPPTVPPPPDPSPPHLPKGALRERILAYLAERPEQAVSSAEIGNALHHQANMSNILKNLARRGFIVQLWAGSRPKPSYYAIADGLSPQAAARLRDQIEAAETSFKHGNGGYDRGCRCEICMAPRREYRRRSLERRRRLSAATASGSSTTRAPRGSPP